MATKKWKQEHLHIQTMANQSPLTESMQLSAGTAETINGIAKNLSDLAANSQALNHSIEEIAAVSEESAAGIEETAATSQQSSSSMEEVANGAENLAGFVD